MQQSGRPVLYQPSPARFAMSRRESTSLAGLPALLLIPLGRGHRYARAELPTAR